MEWTMVEAMYRVEECARRKWDFCLDWGACSELYTYTAREQTVRIDFKWEHMGSIISWVYRTAVTAAMYCICHIDVLVYV